MNHADRRPCVLFLMGPTASGKTALACALAEHFPLDLVSVDSALVYRGMDVGSAKPAAATLQRFPHRLIDIRDPAQAYSAAEFRADALREIEQIHAQGRVPLLVGGTGLYFRALELGLSPLPQADPTLRADLARQAADKGKAYMHERLAKLDPATAARLNLNDVQRVQRALEVIALSGKALSELQGGSRRRLPYRLLKLGLLPRQRVALHARIADRFDDMLAAGLVAELERLRQRADWAEDLPSMRAVGYRQGWPYLDGACSLEDFRLNAIHATRQLAKRQITWLRSELDAWMFDADDATVGERVLRAVAGFLDR
ncbi:MAG: tRNA (adenosine(37)-N6)-dimethylallyltransferase MiaA [Dokdonella sp.]|uniref:tRNA (adenosine(37)-N6)-dimethylallyltransferase MiaA n=1 Tax=Dokdonella sp. TaxID=2291710 RepID=UPI002D055708|nr:tRNA (adenosine(37)-N6)-dimethylallyltransferase MiaA [Xanthomonadales bacterium]HQV73354.1 tRNA (adenosine(37)-N6)-dimethylallyltransferase MiaA [Dokdonella sp.]MBK7209281.1 tRNA (adenosine(37)-N6)-dimethylallyltransferase MiaA [Xanthomonadales bacterium]MBL0223534.1 tRNA (adenosine(37)-N6)-dimethylallyltransferase MiaA [Xanthomonadales bacterium]HQW77537.1 tRNA (adenosine(37)-N6)-dimethylallyltransferase MiaA [Dokdonella sp.]